MNSRPYNDRWQVADKINSAMNQNNLVNQTSSYFTRRTFLGYTSLSVLIAYLPACSKSTDSVLPLTDELIEENEFRQLFEVIFPSSRLKLEDYRAAVLKRIRQLNKEQLSLVNFLYQQFKQQLWLKSVVAEKPYTHALGEHCLATILRSEDADKINKALDIIYMEIIKTNGIPIALWQRKLSFFNKKCVYWSNYDQAVG
jgi:hypothetical protein